MGAILCIKPNLRFPCGVRTTTKFYRNGFNTKLNPKLNVKTFVYKDFEIDFEINDPVMLLDVKMRILKLYPKNTTIKLTIPRDNNRNPIKVEKTFFVYFGNQTCTNEHKHFFNGYVFSKAFERDEKRLIAWSGKEIKQILEDEENQDTINYINHYNKKNNSNLTHGEFVDEILIKKMKLHRLDYVNLSKMTIKISPELYNEIEFTFRYITFEETELEEEYVNVEM